MLWNKNDWQGKSENQIRFSYKVASTAIVILTLIFGVLFVSMLLGCKTTKKVECDAYTMVESK
jgi:hypothetical protein